VNQQETLHVAHQPESLRSAFSCAIGERRETLEREMVIEEVIE
jgi:hypothetical protein